MNRERLVIFDCDSTLSAIEGIDELARLRGPAVLARVEAMTHDAMNGRIALEAVFRTRLELIAPRAADVDAVGLRYVETVEPTARATVDALRRAGWRPMIVSGGFTRAIAPLAMHLGIDDVVAVDLRFHDDGTYAGFDEAAPTARSGGKPEVIAAIRAARDPARVVMVGDGTSDLETAPVVDLFVGFGGYVARPAVRAGAARFITSLAELGSVLAGL